MRLYLQIGRRPELGWAISTTVVPSGSKPQSNDSGSLIVGMFFSCQARPLRKPDDGHGSGAGVSGV